MSYRTPHHIREYLKGACLTVNHEYCLRCTGRGDDYRKKVLTGTNEIDLCARLGTFFRANYRLAAQGRGDADLITDSPPFKTEVKYILPGRTNWNQVRDDWNGLRALSNNGQAFRKRALVWFWPSITLYKFTSCLSVTRDLNDKFSEAVLAPFWPYTNVVMPQFGKNQRIEFAEPRHQGPHGIQLPNGRRFRLDIVGNVTHPLWAVVFTRLTPEEYCEIDPADCRSLGSTAFNISEWV